ncbi:RNA ligase [Tuwongella immobilis]|uniref:T4 RNA ligase 1-like N-terminal domain-containing protein n=1 Tax=Tuwongella immobilis TaxID=692036 RepID=A0A6C2YHL3_9BACT|nr:RNA ligase [Tuwongella immobilis]VIP00907.1 RNA ligase, T4 RnlA OS=Oscillatoria nigro-viridis PCC 7112 GN=Osc7112_2735 PE=4 SV=1: RNA_lig_T4_1 [Tuwongella immobilis]VTR97232.1 RNA ligase, T4 RnlA OS=Oscillatoria nigro-viridis PCC 7112 GN=Osc7112_2735 PE=4 SV=1: RNA_lig_T4_1 [Tuwongella immobilis]
MWYAFDSTDSVHLQRLLDAVRADDADFLEQHSISKLEKSNAVILNYRQAAAPNPVSSLARGLVVDRLSAAIWSMPFRRFANYGESHAHPVDFANSDILEKLDGSMLSVSFPTRNPAAPIWHTRRMLSLTDIGFLSKGFDGEEFRLLEQARTFLQRIRFRPEHTNYTWTFEFLHKLRPVITRYTAEELGLVLIGARQLDTLAEASEDQLDALAGEIGVRRPRRWPALPDREAIRELLQAFPDDFEGVIVRDRQTGFRVKVKSPRYLAMHHLLGKLSGKSLLTVWLAGESSEVIAYYPEAAERLALIANRFAALRDSLWERTQFWTMGMSDRKALAQRLERDSAPPVERAASFVTIGRPEAIARDALTRFLRSWPIDRLCDALQLPEEW